MINFRHKSKVLSSFKATTRANQNYQVSIDVISNKSRFKVRGVSLNLFLNFYKNDFLIDKQNSEQFSIKQVLREVWEMVTSKFFKNS